MSIEAIDRIIVGVETPEQLLEILAVEPAGQLNPPPEVNSTDINLIHPSRW